MLPRMFAADAPDLIMQSFPAEMSARRRARMRRARMRRAGMGIVLILVAPILVAGCGEPADTGDPASAAAESATTPAGVRLDALVEEYYDRYLEANPLQASANGDHRFDDRLPNSLSEQWLADQLALEQTYLARIGEEVDPAELDERGRLTYEQFRFERTRDIEGFRFPAELLPVDQFSSLPLLFAQMGSGGSIQPFATAADYERFLGRIDGFGAWIDQALVNMQAGAARGIVQPRVVVERMLPQLASLLEEDPRKSLFYRPVQAFPEGIATADRARLGDLYARAIAGQVIPAYRRLHDYLATEYLAAARTSVGMRELPNGAAWYAYLVRYHTTTDLDAAAIHAFGLAEVKRIRAQMEQVKTQVQFEGDLAAFMASLRTDPQHRFTSREQALATYEGIRDRVLAAVPALFSAVPEAAFEVRPVEEFRQASAAPASYMPGTPDGSRPGVFYVNTWQAENRPSWMAEAVFLHEAVPGHHFQIATAQGRTDLPRFRRFGLGTAYVEGWGLYAESLGDELGLYADPYQHFGALTAEIWRAVRLVVDTGLHAQGWSRERAIRYMQENTALSEAEIVAEVERYIASPGQALAYKIGQRKFDELRARASRTLGKTFELQAFHAALLEDGALPLAILDAKMARWEASRRP